LGSIVSRFEDSLKYKKFLQSYQSASVLSAIAMPLAFSTTPDTFRSSSGSFSSLTSVTLLIVPSFSKTRISFEPRNGSIKAYAFNDMFSLKFRIV
jgi:hypothetical protein